MFKIVQTTERGLTHLAIVPTSWESNGQLSWPKVGADKLIRNVNSLPGGNWYRMKCKLKRDHLANYEVAEKELDRMLEKDDTEQDGVTETAERRKRARMSPPTRSTKDDFNNLTQSCMMPSEKIEPPTSDILTSQTFRTSNNSHQAGILSNDEQINSLLLRNSVASTGPQLNEKLDNILANQETIVQNQQLIIDNFERLSSNENLIKILQQLAKFEVMLNTTVNHSTIPCSCKHAREISIVNNKEDVFINPIETLEELETLEAKLADKNEMDNFVQKFSYVCGRNGIGNGISNCYTLVDKIFSRKFMTLCSWAGGARDKKEKIPFKMFKNIIYFFFKVVKLSDEEFTLKNCEDFFKGVIRNSTKRNESNLVRTSRSKRRPSSLSYKARCEKGRINRKDENNGESMNVNKDRKDIKEDQGSNEAVGEKSQVEKAANIINGKHDLIEWKEERVCSE